MTSPLSIISRLFRSHEKNTMVKLSHHTVKGRAEHIQDEKYECYMILREFGIPAEHRRELFDKD